MGRHLIADIDDTSNQTFDFVIKHRTESLNASLENVSVVTGDSIQFATTYEWNERRRLIARQNTIYVYTDYRTTANGENIAGFKVGDGTTYLIDLPFTDASSLSRGYVQTATESEWDSQPTLVSEAGVMYIYKDHSTTSSGEEVPAFKIGDGTTYLIDLPFNDDLLTEHINNTTVHITEEERIFWNNKVTAYIGGEEELVLSKSY